MNKKVFVSGCFDLLHSGHIAFFQEAAKLGELYVAIGSDKTVYELKGRTPVNSELERLYMVKSVGCVHHAFISVGSGILDFVQEFESIKPDIFVVNEDGNTPDKRTLCDHLGIKYVILKRTPHVDLTPRSTTSLRTVQRMPYRIDLAGGWLDQPFVSKHHPGSVVTISIEPTIEFNERSGMATSTRRTAIDLWGVRLPVGDPQKLAKILFCCDNPPGKTEISGSQDAIGIVLPGLAKAEYSGEYWPKMIHQEINEQYLYFVERSLYLAPLGPRVSGFDVLSDTQIDRAGAKRLADAADQCWHAIYEQNITDFGSSIRASFEAQIAMFPKMLTPTVQETIEQYRDYALGWKLSGAGGGGYLILVADQPIEGTLQIEARRMME